MILPSGAGAIDGFRYERPFALQSGGYRIVWLQRCRCRHQKINDQERVCGQCGNAIPSRKEYEQMIRWHDVDPHSYLLFEYQAEP